MKNQQGRVQTTPKSIIYVVYTFAMHYRPLHDDVHIFKPKSYNLDKVFESI
jgi:hypothetical protein